MGLKMMFKKGIDKMNCKESLKEYIDKDEIYQDYKQDKLMNCSDFDKFCIQHCKDIEELLEENLELEQALDEIKKILRQPQFEYDNIPCNYEDDIEKIDFGTLNTQKEKNRAMKDAINKLIDEINKLKEK